MNHAITVLEEQLFVLRDLYVQASVEYTGALRQTILSELDSNMRDVRAALRTLRTPLVRTTTTNPNFRFKVGEIAGELG